MSPIKKLLIIACLLHLGSGFAFAQVIIEASPGDVLHLEADTDNHTIQWQTSANAIDWEDIESATTNPFEQLLTNIPAFFRAEITGSCGPVYSETIQVINPNTDLLYWSDPATWGDAGKPQAGQSITIPAGKHIVLDENTPALAGLTIQGTLAFDEMDLTLTSDWIVVHQGQLRIGSASQPFTHKATITLTGDDPGQGIMNMGTRGLLVMEGILELHGATPEVLWTKIDDHAPAGSTSLQLTEAVDWKPGDEIVIGPTDYYLAGNGASVSQQSTLTATEGSLLTISEGLNAFRWGKLQYATTEGISLLPQDIISPPLPDTESRQTPTVLDERAPVGNVTRNIVIQAPDDDLWKQLGFGAHVMLMGPGSSAHVDGVEFRRAGQRGKLGRYPFHWHMLSYSGSQTLEDATGQYIRNSSINSARNRGIVIHGTNGVLVQNNILFDIEGHGIFTEDAVERRNVIDGNLVMKVRNPNLPPAQALKQHEVGERGSSGFWISNPDNTVINNTAADCGTNGFWLAFTDRPWGLSSSVLAEDGLLINPSRIRFGVFDNNTAHSNGMEGINLDLVEADEDGNVRGFIYSSTTDGRNGEWPFPNRRRFSLSNFKVWKNNHRGLWDSSVWPDTYGGVSADNCERFFAGRGTDGIVERCLVVGTSLNHLMNGTDRPYYNFATFHNGGASLGTPVAFATYHSTFDIQGNIIMDFGEAIPNTWSGAFATDDYYTRAVEKGQHRNVNNLLINTHPGVKLKSVGDYFTLASALWDPYGVWGPAGNYFVYDDPFLTYDKDISTVEPSGEVVGGVSVPGPFYGFSDFVLHGVGDTPPQNQPYMDLMGLHVLRLNDEMEQVAEWIVEPAPFPDALLQHMRDFAATPDGIYEISFSWLNPDSYPQYPTDFSMLVENMLTEDDTLVLSIEYDGSLEPTVDLWIYNGYTVPYEQVFSLAELRDSPGETWYQDPANNKVWVKLQGGRWQFWTNDTSLDVPSNDDLLYQPVVLRVFEP